MVYRVFPGILSEYLALKYGPRVVYMDFGDFLASVYIVYRTPPLAPAQGVARNFLVNILDAFRRSLYIPLGIYEGIFGVYPKNTRANFLGKSGSHSKCTKVQRKFVPQCNLGNYLNVARYFGKSVPTEIETDLLLTLGLNSTFAELFKCSLQYCLKCLLSNA